MVDGMELAAKLENQHLVLQVYSDVVDWHLRPIRRVVLGDMEDLASWCCISFAQKRLGDQVRECGGGTDVEPVRICPARCPK